MQRLPKEDLVRLYQELKQQDQLELELKKRRAAFEDEDGEFEAMVTRKSLGLSISHCMCYYGMESAI